MSWKPWKSAEKQASRILCGIRRWRVSYSESVGDIIHPKLSVEVKYGKQIPAILRVMRPTFIAGYYLVPSLRPNFPAVITPTKRKKIGFLECSLRQARNYDPTKIPVVALKPVGYRGIVFACRACDRGYLDEAMEGKVAGKKKGEKTPPPFDISYF